ncbi:MAG: hypothetical protein V4820_11540 [Pseudomonadota bacterium]
MFELIGPAVTLFLAGVGAIIWLVRLEGRINSNKQALAEQAKDLENLTASMRIELATIKARAEADAAAHSETTLALVRVQEQLKYLTSLFERHFVEGPVKRPRRTVDE